MKHGANQERWRRAITDKAFDLIRHLPIIKTKAETLLKVLQQGTVSTNVFLPDAQLLRGHPDYLEAKRRLIQNAKMLRKASGISL